MIKLPLLMSEEENYASKRNRYNIALKYSKKENLLSVIIFKCYLEVWTHIQFSHTQHMTYKIISSQGIYVEKKSNLYVKISLRENDIAFSSKKVKCSNNKTIIDFSKELFFNLQEKDARKCSILIEMKKDLGVGSRSKCLGFKWNINISLLQMRKSASFFWRPREMKSLTTQWCWWNLMTESIFGITQNVFNIQLGVGVTL